MNQNLKGSFLNFQAGKKGIALMAVILIFLSFCPIKRSLKLAFGAPISTTQTHKATTALESKTTCAQCQHSQFIQAGISNPESEPIPPLLFFAATFITTILGLTTGSKQRKGTVVERLIPHSLPYYLQFQQLLFYDK